MTAGAQAAAGTGHRRRRRALLRARTYLVAGDLEGARGALRALRSAFPNDALVADSYVVETEVSLAADDPLRTGRPRRASPASSRAPARRSRQRWRSGTGTGNAPTRHGASSTTSPPSPAYGGGPDRAGLDRALLRAAAVESGSAATSVQPGSISGRSCPRRSRATIPSCTDRCGCVSRGSGSGRRGSGSRTRTYPRWPSTATTCGWAPGTGEPRGGRCPPAVLRGLPEPDLSPGLRAPRPAGLGRDLRGALLLRARIGTVVGGERAAGAVTREGARRSRPRGTTCTRVPSATACCACATGCGSRCPTARTRAGS